MYDVSSTRRGWIAHLPIVSDRSLVYCVGSRTLSHYIITPLDSTEMHGTVVYPVRVCTIMDPKANLSMEVLQYFGVRSVCLVACVVC